MSVFWKSRISRCRATAMLVVTLMLVACGGGGGGAGDPVVGGGNTGTTPTIDTATVAVSLSSDTVTAGSPATVKALVKNRSGSALAGLVVKFATDANLGALSAPSALTDAEGVASVVLSPAQASTAGADLVRATVTYLDANYVGTAGFQLTATNVSVASFTSDVSQLSAYGQANLTVTLAGSSATSAVSLGLSSSCTTSGKGSITPSSQTTTTGRAVFTFRDGGCGAIASAENLQVSIAGTAITQSLSLPVSSPAVASIGFVSAEPANIYLRGSGLIENSNVTFKVKDANNNGLPGQAVVLEPSVSVGGLTLDGVTTAVTKQTDSEGNVVVRVNSGTVPTPVRIKATLQASSISTVSSVLSVAVGLPSQLNFSLAQGTINIEGYDIQGTPNTYTIIASDRLGNPVPDGTAINFVTEGGGQIQASQQTALNGSGIAIARANFASAEPRPVDGRITVVAYALGEESFLDVNGNNVYDSGEDYQDLGDVFIDRKYDNLYDGAEDQFISVTRAEDKTCAAASSSLLATGVTIPTRPGTCSGNWGRAYVRRAAQTVLSRSAAAPMWGNNWPVNAFGTGGVCGGSVTLTTRYSNNQAVQEVFRQFGTGDLYVTGKTGTFTFYASDANTVAYNPMAAGTVVTVATTLGVTAGVAGGSPVPNSSVPTAVTVNYSFDDVTTDGTVTVTLRSPGGLGTAIPVRVNRGVAPAGLAVCSS